MMFDLQVRPILKPWATSVFFGIIPSVLIGIISIFSNHISDSIYFGSLNALGMLIAVIVLLKFLEMTPLLKHWFKANWKYSLIGLVIGILMSTLRFEIIVRTGTNYPGSEILLLNDLIHNNLYIKAIILFLPVVLFYPILEEICFRGMVQTSFSNLYKSPWTSVFLTSCLFALLHLTSRLDWSFMLYVFVVGMVLSIIKNRSLSLWPPIILHSAYNSTELILKLKALH